MEINLNVSKRFEHFINDWNYETYLSIGGYGSGKSHSIVQKIILKCLQEKRKVLVGRAVFETIRESCFALFKDVLSDMGLLEDSEIFRRNRNMTSNKVIAIVSPMELRFPNGSRVIFKGLDNKENIKSLHGVSIVWVEECSEIRYDVYMELLSRIRQPNVSLHFLLSCNPVGKENWVYSHFFVRTKSDGTRITIQDENELYKRKTLINKTNGVYYMHSVLDDNPFLPKSYIRRINALKETDIYLWVVARWGRFGSAGLRVLPNFRIAKNAREFKKAVNSISAYNHYFGIDFGFEESFNALLSMAVDDDKKILYIYDEVYINKITDDLFIKLDEVQKVKQRAERCEKPICADSAEPKTIQFYRQQGFEIYGAKKYIGSRLQNTKKVKRFNKIICSPKCKNTIRELQTLTYKVDSKGNAIYDEFNIDPHTFSAIWYALDNYYMSDLKEIKTNSRKGANV